jgi:hypothetical protein
MSPGCTLKSVKRPLPLMMGWSTLLTRAPNCVPSWTLKVMPTPALIAISLAVHDSQGRWGGVSQTSKTVLGNDLAIYSDWWESLVYTRFQGENTI